MVYKIQNVNDLIGTGFLSPHDYTRFFRSLADPTMAPRRQRNDLCIRNP
jgi:hypothetical protein